MQHNIYFLISWQKKNIYLSIDKRNKTNHLLLHPWELFPVYFHTVGDTISYILCTPPCVYKNKRITVSNTYYIQIKAIFWWSNNKKKGDIAFTFHTVKKTNNNASTCYIFNNTLKHDTYMNTIKKNICLQFSVHLRCTKPK